MKKNQNYWLPGLSKKLLESGTKISFYSKMVHELLVYFTGSSVECEIFVSCPNVKELLIHMDHSKRSSHRRCSVRKGVLKNFTKFTGKHLCQSLFFDKVQGSPRGHYLQMKEKYVEIKTVLKLIKYDNHKWIIHVFYKNLVYMNI